MILKALIPRGGKLSGAQLELLDHTFEIEKDSNPAKAMHAASLYFAYSLDEMHNIKYENFIKETIPKREVNIDDMYGACALIYLESNGYKRMGIATNLLKAVAERNPGYISHRLFKSYNSNDKKPDLKDCYIDVLKHLGICAIEKEPHTALNALTFVLIVIMTQRWRLMV